jgi:hypothetical protein
MDIFNYYFSFLKLIAVWNKVSQEDEISIYINMLFSFMWRTLIMEYTIQNKFYNNLERNYNVLKLLLKQAS